MPLAADFLDAHCRHWRDAEFLYNDQRLPNADHLYGFSAECGLKAALFACGIKPDPTGNPPQQFKVHIQDLWSVFKGTVSGRTGNWFLSKLPQGSPFGNWSHHDRYASGSGIQQGQVDTHRAAAQGIFRMIKRAKQEGIM